MQKSTRKPMQEDVPEMRVFSKARDVTNAWLLLCSLKENLHFLKDGLGNVIVTQVEYCKCCCSKGRPWEHEFLLVTLKESVGAGRMALLLVDRLMDDTKEYAGGQDGLLADISKHQSGEIINIEATDWNSTAESESRALPAARRWGTRSRIHRSGAKVKRSIKGDLPEALDRLIILPNSDAIAKELGNCPFHILMMDLTQSQVKVTLEQFVHLLQTASRNTPQYNVIFAQCYWVVLGKSESVNMVRSPETIKAEWDAERPAENQRWAEMKQYPETLHADARREAEGRRKAEARVLELERRVECPDCSARSATAL
ncbi:hypothetical protein EDD85DRAFT_788800 [Armillaria nabsnona]|nr:hypothetical protein EDD85DRAFT_788800 [Armillaria nabsnona]